MNSEIREEWVTALRSGEYKQGKHRLHKSNRFTESPDEYCCLGVLCELAVQHNIIPPAELDIQTRDYLYGTGEDVSPVALPQSVQEWAELENTSPFAVLPASYDYGEEGRESLVGMNDSGDSFNVIADMIENLTVV